MATSLLLCICLVLAYMAGTVISNPVDCCSSQIALGGSGCTEGGVTVDSAEGSFTAFCVAVPPEGCAACMLAKALPQNGQCTHCCTKQRNGCGTLTPLQQMVTLTSLTLICVVFAVSCFCCTVMFIDTERSRMKEGITFQEAYLIPIPIVTVVVDMDPQDEDEDTVVPAPPGHAPQERENQAYSGAAGDGDEDEDSLIIEVETPFERPVAQAHHYTPDLVVAQPTQHSYLTHGDPNRRRRR